MPIKNNQNPSATMKKKYNEMTSPKRRNNKFIQETHIPYSIKNFINKVYRLYLLCLKKTFSTELQLIHSKF